LTAECVLKPEFGFLLQFKLWLVPRQQS